MVSINYASREVTCKIVYYGPGLSGKTTNLIYVHKKVPANSRGKLISLATEADRTLYFDFLPINLGTINGFAAKFQLYTVPGQVYYNATRKLVLRGVDGLVFVADSQAEKMDENIESLSNLKENLEEYGYNVSEMPIVIQYNKRDLPGALPVSELEAKLNPMGWIHFEGEAVSGRGVFDTLKMIIKLVLEKAKSGKSTVAAPRSPEPSEERVTVAAPVSVGSSSPVSSGESSPKAAAHLESEPIRRPAYETAGDETNESESEEDGEAVEYGTLPEDKINARVDAEHVPIESEAVEVSETGPDEAALSSADLSQRPFPGSTSARILRRERRITVSDFQPAARVEDSAAGQPTGLESQGDLNADAGLPTPTMAPSMRMIKKKQGFFKRLFGIK
jgi:signal recognition particle receptor subunit beta